MAEPKIEAMRWDGTEESQTAIVKEQKPICDACRRKGQKGDRNGKLCLIRFPDRKTVCWGSFSP